MGFENDLPESIKDYNFSDKETCSCFKSVSGSFPYKPTVFKSRGKSNPEFKKKKNPVSRMKLPVSLPWALGGKAEIKESVFFFMFHLLVL